MFVDEKRLGEVQTETRNQRIARILRTTNARQLRRNAFDNRGGYCVIGLLEIEHGFSFDRAEQIKLVVMNDDDQLTFAEIADRVEAGAI